MSGFNGILVTFSVFLCELKSDGNSTWLPLSHLSLSLKLLVRFGFK